ncbi:unnamed protein product [Fusarium graminearum]|uniref:Uncharacterized protein n=1 Tax=Gibberella zeae TaxID=5518 RepID=A0A4U9EPT3_GIBZA|nr:unnamed protein product [Fusarium graminearum]CAF3477536.1 unnamed protein product [Fusarium graminearum]CAF3662940.1 unnamed protein product [Fusarium graminearum]CAG1959776.1 unnamed protein product [Fusarium graminearum]CAG1974695.1 unnamed protein product [Fusarium graminearum]
MHLVQLGNLIATSQTPDCILTKKKVRAQRPLPTRITDLLVIDNPVSPKECPELYSTRHSHYSWTRITVREDLICYEIEFLAGGFPEPE